jgi:hypothetical protein
MVEGTATSYATGSSRSNVSPATDPRILALLLADRPDGFAIEIVPRSWGRLDRAAAREGRAVDRLRQLAPATARGSGQ